METNALGRISSLAKRQLELEQEVEAAERRLAVAKERLRQVAEEELPEAMEAVEMESFRLEDGSEVSIKQSYYASIPKAHQDAALQWLRDNGFDGLIKHNVTLDFGKGEESEAQAALAVAQQHGWRTADKETVHPQTLKAFVKEQIQEGSNLPLELFGVHRITQAKIKRSAV